MRKSYKNDIMKKNLLVFGLLLSCVSVYANHTGHVFVDSNRNGIYDKGEKPLGNICVSDGKNVVKTDRKGFFSLPGHERERFIFITTPSGYKTDNAYYKKIVNEDVQYDFGVVPYNAHINKDGSHKFIQISDTEIGATTAEHDDWIQNIRDYVFNEHSAFVIHTGDICYEPGLNNHIKIMNTANMNTQIFYCIGNHDLVRGKYGEEVFEKNYGPVYYSFDVGSVHYIVTPMPGGDYAPGYTQEDVYYWLKNDLDQQPDGKPIMVFNHDILTYGEEFKFFRNKEEFIDLDAKNLKAWIYGHWHINHIHKHKKAYSICTSTLIRGGIDHASSAFRIFHVDKNGDFNTELRYTYINKGLEISSLDNLHAPISRDGKLPLYVNTYSTVSKTEKVNYSCFIENQKIIDAKPLVQNTDFNWNTEVKLPSEAKGKLITISVEARYENGEVAKRNHSFIYMPNESPEIELNNGSWTNLAGNAAHSGVQGNAKDANPRLKWIANVGSNIYMAAPVLENGKLFIATVDENNAGKAAVYALDAVNGNVLWKAPVKGSVKNSIALTSGKVFAQDIYGNLYSFDQKDGRVVWEKKLKTKTVPALNDGLAAEEHVVYAGTGASLCAVDADSGKDIWNNDSWNSREGCTATLSIGQDFVIGGSHWGALYANDKKTGKYLWGESKDGLRNRSAAPAVVDGLLYMASLNSFFIIDGHTGKIINKKNLGVNVDVASTPLVTENTIVFGTAENGVMALDKETLEKKWEFKTSPSIIYSSPYTRNPSCTVETSPALSGNTVYFGASDGYLYGLDLNTGTLKWKHATGAPVWGSVCVVGNGLFAVDFAGNVYGFVIE